MANMSDIKREEYEKKNEKRKAALEEFNNKVLNAAYKVKTKTSKPQDNSKQITKNSNKKVSKNPVLSLEAGPIKKSVAEKIAPAYMERTRKRQENKKLLKSGLKREEELYKSAKAVMDWRNSFGAEYDLKYQEGKRYKDFLEGKLSLSDWEQQRLKPSYDWFEANIGFKQHEKDQKHIDRYTKAAEKNDMYRKIESDFQFQETGLRVNLDEYGNVDFKGGASEASSLQDRTNFRVMLDNTSIAERQRIAEGNGTPEENERAKRMKKHGEVYSLEESKKEAYEYYGKNYDNKYKDNLGGRLSGNYKLGRVGIKTNDAGYTAFAAGSDDLEAVEVYQLLAGKIQENNIDTFTNNNKWKEALATNAQYAPQAVDQFLAGLPGMTVSLIPGGKIAGSVMSNSAQAGYMFRQTAGAAFIKNIQENGISVSDARTLARNEGLISGTIEFAVGSVFDSVGGKIAESAVSIKAQKGLFKGLVNSGVSENGAKIILNSAKSAGRFLYDNIGEGTEEWLQEGVSITAGKMARDGKVPGVFELAYNSFNVENYSDDELEQMNDAAKGSFLIALGRAGVSKIGNISTSKVNRIMNSMENRNVGKAVLSMRNSDNIVFSAIEFGKQSENEGTKKAADYLDSVYLSGKTPSEAKVGGFLKQVANEGHDVFDIKDNDTRYSVSYTKDNKPVAVIDEDILDGVPKEKWVKVTKNKLKEFSAGIPVSGRTIYINREARNEYTNSEQSKYFHATQEEKFADKMRAAGNIDDVMLASVNYVNEDLKHESDRFKEFAEGEVLLKVGDNTYKARVKVGLNKQNKMYLHDVLDMDKVDFELKKSADSKYGQLQNASAIMGESPDSYSISQDESVVKKFLISDEIRINSDISKGEVNRIMNSMENRNVGKAVLSMRNSDNIVFSAIEFGKQSENEGTKKAADYLDSVYLSGKTPSEAKVGGFLKQVANEGHDVFGVLGSDTKYSISPDFTTNYDKWVKDGRPDRKAMSVGTTSEPLKSIGVKEQNITWDTTKINKSLKKHPYLDDGVMKQIPDILERPIIIMQSKQSDSRLTMFGEVYDKDGLPVMAVLELLPTNMSRTVILDEIKIISTHSRKNKNNPASIQQTQNMINSSDILYIEPNKKRTDSWLTLNRLQLPLSVNNYGSIKSITYPGQNVKTFSLTNKENTSSQESVLEISDLSERAANIFNFKVVIDDTIQITDEDENVVGEADGYYKDGVLYLSRNAKKPLEFVLSHEIVHHLQRIDKKSYNVFRMLALRYTAQQRGMAINELISEKQDTYKKVDLLRSEAIDEIAADFAGEHISGEKLQSLLERIENGEFIQNTEQGRSIIQRFINAIRDIIDRIKVRYSSGKYFDKAVELESVIDAYEKAIVGAYKNKDKLSNADTGIKFSKSIEDYPYDMQKVIKEYIEYSNPQIRNFVNSVNSGEASSNSSIQLDDISDKAAEKIKSILNVDVTGYKVSLDRSMVEHIEKRHGKNGNADKSMANIADIERMQYVLNNYDDIVYGGGTKAYTTVKENGIAKLADTVLYSKKINGTYYVVQAVPITKSKTLRIVSAFIKKEASQLPDVQSPEVTSKTPSVNTSNKSISQNDKDVKYHISKENGINSDIAPLFDESMSKSDNNAEFETDDPEGLKDTIRYLRARSEYLKGKKVSPSTVLEFARELKKTYESSVSSRDLAVDIMKLYNEAARVQVSEDSDMVNVYNKAREIAKKILSNVQVEFSQDVKNMRNHIRNTGITLSEQDKGDFGDKSEWNRFRKANFGRIKITDKGISVDTFYKELCELYPEYFNEDEYTHPADQIRHIAKVLDDTKSVTMTDIGKMDSDSAELLLTTEILEKFSSSDADEKSVISEIEKIERETKKEYEAKRKEDKDSLKEWFKERYAKIQEARRIEIHLAQENAKEKINKIRGERRAADDRKKLLKLLQFFDKLRTTPERIENIKNKMNEEELESFKDIEEFAGKTPEEIVRMLDSWGVRLMEEGYERTDGVKVMGRLELSELKAEYEKVKEADPDFMPNRILEQKFERLNKIQIDTLTDGQVRELIELLAGVKTQVENENKFLATEEEKRVDYVTKNVHKELKDGKDFMDRDMGFGGVTDKSIIKKWKIWQLNAMTVFKKLAGYLPNSEVYGLAKMLQDGQKRKTSFERIATRHFEEFFNKHPEMRRTVKSIKKDEWIKVKDGWSISPGMRIALYLHSKNASNMESIRDFGITLPKESIYKNGKKKDAYNQGNTIKLSAKDVREIVKGMTEDELEFADNYAYTFFNGVTTRHINEVSRKLLGYDVAIVKNYFPKNSDMNMVETENVGVYDMLGTVEGQGFLKHRKGGKPVLLLDVFDVIDRTTAGVAKYYGMGLAMRDVRKVLGKSADGGKTTLGLIAELHGEDMKRWVEDLLRDYENPKVDQQLAKERARGIRNRFASSVLVGRVSTLLKQGGAFFTGLPEVGMKNWSKSMGRHVTKKDIELWQDASSTFWQRGTDLRKIDPRAWIENVDKFWVQRLCSGIMVGIESDFKIKRNTKSDEYWEALRQPEVMAEIGKRIDDMINNTQSVYTTMERPTILREDKALLKHLLPFKTQNFQDFNMLSNIQEFRALAKYAKQGKATKEEVLAARKKCLNTVLGLSLNYVFGSVATLLATVILGQNMDDRYEEEGENEEEERKMYDELSPFWKGVNDIFNKDGKGVITPKSVKEKMITDTINGFAGDFMFADEAVNWLQSSVSGKKYYGIEIGFFEMINDTLSQAGRTIKSVTEIGADDFSLKQLLTNVKDLAIQTGGLFAGVPGKNIEDVFIAALFHGTNAIEQVNNKYDVSFYFNPYKVKYDLLKDMTNIKSNRDWYIEQFYDAARFAVNIKNPKNRQMAYDDLNRMFWEASSKITNEEDRANFQEKVYKEFERLGYRNSNVIKRVLADKESIVEETIVDYVAVDAEVKRLNMSGADIDFKPDKRAVLTYTVTDENGNEIEKSVTLTPTESIRYAEDVKQMIYAAFNDAMNDSTWRIRTDEERVDIFSSYKKDAIAMVKQQYIRNKTGETVASTPFEIFEEERMHRKDEQSLYKVPGNKYVYLDNDTSVYYELPDGLAKEYDAAYNRNLKEIGEAIFTDKADISLYISGTYKRELYYSEMTDKQRKNTITSIESTATKNKLSEQEKQQLISDFINNKNPYEKQIAWGGIIDDLSILEQDKLYDKIKQAAKQETEAELGNKIKLKAKVVYTKNTDLTWVADINDEIVRTEQESVVEEPLKKQEQPIDPPEYSSTPTQKVSYRKRAYKSSSNNAYNSKVQNYNYSNKNPFPVKTENGVKSVKVGTDFYSRADINIFDIGYKYRRLTKAPQDFKDLTYNEWRTVMDTWIRCLAEWKFTDADRKTLQMEGSGLDAVFYEPESVAAAFWEWVQYGEDNGFDTSEYLEQ